MSVFCLFARSTSTLTCCKITNSAPNHSVLGTLNGLAQTLSAAGRAVGPFISGSLFTASVRLKTKGEALAFGVFGGVAFVGFLMSFVIRNGELEDSSYHGHEDEGSDHDEEEEEDETETETEAETEDEDREQQPLIRR